MLSQSSIVEAKSLSIYHICLLLFLCGGLIFFKWQKSKAYIPSRKLGIAQAQREWSWSLRTMWMGERHHFVPFRLRLFRLNLISGNQFPENRAFGCAGKFGQTEIIFSLTGKYAKNDWNWIQSLFSLQTFSGNTHKLSQALTTHTHCSHHAHAHALLSPTEMIFSPNFRFKSFPETRKERKRERKDSRANRERERERDREPKKPKIVAPWTHEPQVALRRLHWWVA